MFRVFLWPRSKHLVLFFLSLVAIYWFQTPSAIRHLSFWLPTILLGIAVFTWKLVFSRGKDLSKDDHQALILIFSLPIIFYLVRLSGLTRINFISDLPKLVTFVVFQGLTVILMVIATRFSFVQKSLPRYFIFLFIGLLILLKNQFLTERVSSILRLMNGQSTTMASAFDISWIGYSYFAFRLIQMLVERERINKTGISLRDFVTFLIFFPAFTAGPIDRYDHFFTEINQHNEKESNSDLIEGMTRIFIGLFQKFILADSLAMISMNSYTARMIINPAWQWISIYAYAFRIFFDFSGYTGIAIGIARIAGINLPENFKAPYLSRNITLFWNNWHITLTQWFRTYYFNPVTRFLRLNYKNVSPAVIILFTQITTMVLIGLWHGISWNFVIWGFWNGLGLFIHNRWSEKIKPKLSFLYSKPYKLPFTITSVLLTFHYITIGWVWFAMPSINESITILKRLF